MDRIFIYGKGRRVRFPRPFFLSLSLSLFLFVLSFSLPPLIMVSGCSKVPLATLVYLFSSLIFLLEEVKFFFQLYRCACNFHFADEWIQGNEQIVARKLIHWGAIVHWPVTSLSSLFHVHCHSVDIKLQTYSSHEKRTLSLSHTFSLFLLERASGHLG